MRAAAMLATMMVVQFALLTMNYRFIAHSNYVGAVATDAAIAALGWSILKRVQEATSWHERTGYVIGAALGSVIGIWLT